LQYPHVTEKASSLVEKNQYTFRVTPEANKVEVKKAIEEIYGVDVVDVRMTSIPAKKRQRGRIEGWTKGYKKAIVRVKEGQKIEVLPR
jgi:large subunit ribosomal protein L23